MHQQNDRVFSPVVPSTQAEAESGPPAEMFLKGKQGRNPGLSPLSLSLSSPELAQPTLPPSGLLHASVMIDVPGCNRV